MELETHNTKYTLVFCILPKRVRQRSQSGFVDLGYKSGLLVKSNRYGCDVWYHEPKEYLEWKKFLYEV